MKKYIRSLKGKSQEELTEEYKKQMDIVGEDSDMDKISKAMGKARIVIALIDNFSEEKMTEIKKESSDSLQEAIQ